MEVPYEGSRQQAGLSFSQKVRKKEGEKSLVHFKEKVGERGNCDRRRFQGLLGESISIPYIVWGRSQETLLAMRGERDTHLLRKKGRARGREKRGKRSKVERCQRATNPVSLEACTCHHYVVWGGKATLHIFGMLSREKKEKKGNRQIRTQDNSSKKRKRSDSEVLPQTNLGRIS